MEVLLGASSRFRSKARSGVQLKFVCQVDLSHTVSSYFFWKTRSSSSHATEKANACRFFSATHFGMRIKKRFRIKKKCFASKINLFGIKKSPSDPCKCRRFWTLGSSWSLKSVNSHRDCVAQGLDPRKFHRFWTLGSSRRLKSVNSHRDRGGRGRDPRNCPSFFNPRSLRQRAIKEVTRTARK